METHDAETRLMKEYKLSEQQAKFCILVASGQKPIDAVQDAYSYTNKTNSYGQLKKLVQNQKINEALKSLGMNLKEKFEKGAYAVITALEDIAFGDTVSTRDKLTALKELAAYNPMLQTMKKKDAEDTEEQDLANAVKEWLSGEEPS